MPDAIDLLLTREQLERLTGTVQPKRMCDWLKKARWVFEPPARRGDIPKVSRAYHDARLSGVAPVAAGQPRRRPNTSWMTEPA